MASFSNKLKPIVDEEIKDNQEDFDEKIMLQLEQIEQDEYL